MVHYATQLVFISEGKKKELRAYLMNLIKIFFFEAVTSLSWLIWRACIFHTTGASIWTITAKLMTKVDMSY